MRAFDAALSVEWAMRPEALRVLLDMARRAHEPNMRAVIERTAERERELNAMSAVEGTVLNGTRNVRMRGGVAVVPVVGPIFRYANLFTSLSGATSLQMIAHEFNTALRDPNVESLLLHIDSPGGQANGVGEFADMIFESRGDKPIRAYVSHEGASAAYWIASACDEIICSPMSILGSIGVVCGIRKGEDDEHVEFVSSQSPRKRIDPTTEVGRAQIQGLVDDWAEVFIQSVARNRGVSVETVATDFGKGDVLIGHKAVSVGLADRLGSFEAAVHELQNRRSQTALAPAASTTTSASAWMPTTTTGTNSVTIRAQGKVISTEARRPMSVRDRLLSLIGRLSESEFEDVIEAPEASSEPTAPTTPSTPEPAAAEPAAPTPEGGTEPMSEPTAQSPAAAQTTSAFDNAEISRLREQLASRESEMRRLRAERIVERAEEWVERVITVEHHAAPVEADHLINLYVQAATDDSILPLEAMNGQPVVTRVQMLQAAYAARPENLLDRETLISGLRDLHVASNTIRSITPGSGPDGKMTPERKEELLSMTSLGRKIRKERHANGAH